MKQKIISIIIAVIAIVACAFAVVFAMRFDDSKKSLYKDIAMIQETNPELITAFNNLKQVSEVPQFVATQREKLAELDKTNRAIKLQKDILYTYMTMVSEVKDSNFKEFQANYPQLVSTLLAQYENQEMITKDYANVQQMSDMNSHFLSMKNPYNKLKQEYLANKEYLKAVNAFVNMADQATQAVSEKRQNEEFQVFKNDVESVNSWNFDINFAVVLTYAIFGLALLAVLGFVVYYLCLNLRSALKTLITLLVLAIIVVVSYFIASPELSPVAIKAQVTPMLSKLVSTGMILVYIAFVSAIIVVIGSTVWSIIKKAK